MIATKNPKPKRNDQIRDLYDFASDVFGWSAQKTISNGFPEAGGGGAAAEVADADATGADGATPEASDDDDDDDDDGGDGDPDPKRRSPRTPPKTPPSSSGTHRNATATAGALNSTSPIAPLWRLPTVLAHVPVSRSGWWAGVAAGIYPKPVKLSARCVAWKSEEIRLLINSF